MKNRPVYGGIPIAYTPVQNLSIDIKTMPQAFRGYHLFVMIWKEFLGYQIFFVIFIKHGYYLSGSGAQVLIVMNFKLH